MKRSVMIGILVVVAVLILVFAFSSLVQNQKGAKDQKSNNEGPSIFFPVVGNDNVKEMNVNTGQGDSSSTEPRTHTVEITSSGFIPRTLEIKKGDTVIWVNKGTRESWPASAIHPTHTVYPGSSIEKCGTSEEPNIFDACRGISQGSSYSFTFNELGEWRYHDHLQPSFTGSIIVSQS